MPFRGSFCRRHTQDKTQMTWTFQSVTWETSQSTIIHKHPSFLPLFIYICIYKKVLITNWIQSKFQNFVFLTIFKDKIKMWHTTSLRQVVRYRHGNFLITMCNMTVSWLMIYVTFGITLTANCLPVLLSELLHIFPLFKESSVFFLTWWVLMLSS